MEEQQTQREPKYFIANFGPKYACEHPVDGGRFPVLPWFDDTKMISKGDIMLLCCWGGHKEGHGDAWGLGKVTSKEEREGRFVICYDPEPFPQPIEHDTIYNCLTDGEQKRFEHPHLTSSWLIEIRPSSF